MLSKKEEDVLSLINEQEMIDFLVSLIRINSENPPGNEKEIGDFLAHKLQDVGCQVELQEVEGDRRNVIAVVEGKSPEKLLFHCHIDTVPFGNPCDWHVPPGEGKLRDGLLYGRGASDMKSGLAAAVFAIDAILKSGIELKKGMMLTGVVDEEVYFKGIQRLFDEHKLMDCKMAYVCEPSSLEIMTSLKGGIEFTAGTVGKTVQSGMAFLGENAIIKMAKVINALEEYNNLLKKKMELPGLRYPTVNVGTIKGGSGVTAVPDMCEIDFDRQVLPGEDLAEARQEVIKVIGQVEKDYGIVVKLKENQYFNSWTVSKEAPVVKNLAESFWGIFQRKPVYSGVNGYCEAELLASKGISSVVFGPGDLVTAHTPNEKVLVQNVIDAAKVYALTALRSVRE